MYVLSFLLLASLEDIDYINKYSNVLLGFDVFRRNTSSSNSTKTEKEWSYVGVRSILSLELS